VMSHDIGRDRQSLNPSCEGSGSVGLHHIPWRAVVLRCPGRGVRLLFSKNATGASIPAMIGVKSA